MRNKLCVYYWNVSCPPSTGSKCEMLVCMKLLLFIVGAEHIPGAAATTDQKTWPRTKKLNPPPIFWRLVWLVFEIDFEINFDHEQMGPPPPLRLSLLLFSCCPSDVFVLIFRTRRPQGGGAGTLETFWHLWRGSLSYQSYATELCNCRKKKQVASEVLTKEGRSPVIYPSTTPNWFDTFSQRWRALNRKANIDFRAFRLKILNQANQS